MRTSDDGGTGSGLTRAKPPRSHSQLGTIDTLFGPIGDTPTPAEQVSAPTPTTKQAAQQVTQISQRLIDELLGSLSGPTETKKSFVSDVPSALAGLKDALANGAPPATSDLSGHVTGYGSAAAAQAAVVARMQQEADSTARDSAEQTLADALRRQREVAIGVDGSEDPDDPLHLRKRTKPMTWHEYNALSPLQKAAVDYNSMLVKAVSKDRRLADKYDPTDKEQTFYDQSVEQLFGTDSGSSNYAPETVALLKSLPGYVDDSAQLDDFLRLKATISAKDLEGLHAQTAPTAVMYAAGMPTTAESERADLVRSLATSTRQMEAQVAKGNALLQSITAIAAKSRENTIYDLGGRFTEPFAAAGFGSPDEGRAITFSDGSTQDLDSYFQMAIGKLAEVPEQRDDIFGILKDELSPMQMQKFMAYADDLSGNAERFHVHIGGKGTMTPEEFRVLIGLEKGQAVTPDDKQKLQNYAHVGEATQPEGDSGGY